MGGYIRLLVVSLTLILAPTADSAAAKDRFTYFGEAQFFVVDETGVETWIFVTAIDRPTTQDVLAIEISRSNPACADPGAECDYILIQGYVEAPVAEKDIRVQHNLFWARTDASTEFPDQVSGSTIPVTISLDWTATGAFAPEFDDGSGFRRAIAEGSIRLADEELLGRQSDQAEIARFILSS
jgi:hypothetical protein